MLGRPGSTDTWTGVGYQLPRLRELPQRMSDHIGHDFDIDEVLAIVDPDGSAYHFGKDVHAAAVGPDDSFAVVLPDPA